MAIWPRPLVTRALRKQSVERKRHMAKVVAISIIGKPMSTQSIPGAGWQVTAADGSVAACTGIAPAHLWVATPDRFTLDGRPLRFKRRSSRRVDAVDADGSLVVSVTRDGGSLWSWITLSDPTPIWLHAVDADGVTRRSAKADDYRTAVPVAADAAEAVALAMVMNRVEYTLQNRAAYVLRTVFSWILEGITETLVFAGR